MSRLLVSAAERERWRQAFPEGRVSADLADADSSAIASVWLDLAALEGEESLCLLQSALALGVPVIALAAVPDQAEALRLMQAGAHGYCHVEAAPEQLREVALVVEHGGLWMPSALMQRFLAMSVARVPLEAPRVIEIDALTSREVMVAEQVAHGASNREIATALSISERTVKAHLTAIFDKLAVRDRVQLALVMNNIPTHSSVN